MSLERNESYHPETFLYYLFHLENGTIAFFLLGKQLRSNSSKVCSPIIVYVTLIVSEITAPVPSA